MTRLGEIIPVESNIPCQSRAGVSPPTLQNVYVQYSRARPHQSVAQLICRPSQPGCLSKFCSAKRLNVSLIARPPFVWSMLW
jgi:hypothetical protein